MPELDRIFVSIAVSRPDGDLDELPGAINASERMADWADQNQYISLIINDKIYPEVTVDLLRAEVSRAINEVTKSRALRRVIFFFAGHGAALGIDDQNWMLSNWNKRPNEAIKVSSLQRMLEYYGPEQVTIIGDACQEFSARFIEVVGSPILDKTDEARRDFELDRFFPVDAGSQAFMIKAAGENKAFCLFTEVMLDALEGDAPAKYFEAINGGRHVTSQTLAQYLKDNLSAEAGKHGVRMDPRPRPGFYTDRIYYSKPSPPLVPQEGPLRSTSLRPGMPRSPRTREPIGEESAKPVQRKQRSVAKVKLAAIKSGPATAKKLAALLDAQRSRAESAYSAAADGDVRNHFETGCGICFTGAAVDIVQASRGSLSQVGLPLNWYRLDLSNDHDPYLWSDVVVDLPGGGVASACVIQNFITAMHAFDGGGINVLHRPLYASADEGHDIIALLGKMQAGSLSETEIVDAAAFLRWEKHRVITMGAIVAQFYDSIRDTASLCSIAAFYAQKNQPIPLDVVLFGGGRLFARPEGLYADVPATLSREPRSPVERDRQYTFAATPAVAQHPVAGRVPWMRQAWGAIETADCDESAEDWRKLALAALPHIGVGPFTLAKPEGRDAILALADVNANRENPAPLVAYA
jgi:hypothetical protein